MCAILVPRRIIHFIFIDMTKKLFSPFFVLAVVLVGGVSIAHAEELATTPTLIVATPFRFEQNLTVGSRGEAVLKLQQFLNKTPATAIAAAGRPGSAGKETSVFGPATTAAVKAFQKAHGLPMTGFVGKLTRAALNEAMKSVEISLPTVLAISANTDTSGSAVVTARYHGGGEKPKVWFAYGATATSMSILSPEKQSESVAGTTQVTISGLGSGDCYVQAFVKNSVGTAESEAVHCAK